MRFKKKYHLPVDFSAIGCGPFYSIGKIKISGKITANGGSGASA
jgi:hypothetical protein